jgi:type III restriction enzyme
MLPLKDFQKRVVNELKDIFGDINFYIDQKLGSTYQASYGRGIDSLGIKIPTGGGKTIVAVNSLPILLDKIKGKRVGLVLWLVPTDTIVRQTIKKFTEKDDFHKQYLNSFFDNEVLVKDSNSIWNTTKNDLENHVVIFVCTFAYFRITEDKAQMRKIWGQEAVDKFGEYWDSVNINKFKNKLYEYNVENNKFLMYPTETNRFDNTLANLIITQNPITIIDEIHKAKSSLSKEAIKRLNPSFVLKFSATPTDKDNVIITVSGDELFKENMIKLPIYITINKNENEVLEETIKKQRELEKIGKSSFLIRPIVLVQAEKKSKTLFTHDVETIKDKLINEFKINDNEIAIAYKEKDEIFDVNLYSEDCPIRYILTVDKLREGWDCSFAYILCNLRNLSSPVAVEQIIGRILRKYKAKPIDNDELSKAYVFTIAKETTTKQDIHFQDVAKYVASALQEQNGYTEDDFYIEVTDARSGDIKNNYFDVIVKDNFKIEVNTLKLHPLCLLNKQIKNQSSFLESFSLLKEDYKININSCLDDIEREFEINPIEEEQIKEIINSYKKHKFDLDDNIKIREIIIFISKKISKLPYDAVYSYVKKVIEKNILNNNNISEEDKQKVLLNKWKLLIVIKEKIEENVDGYAKRIWHQYLNDGKIGINDKIYSQISSKILGVRIIEDNFQKHIYDKCPILNNEERTFAIKLDECDNVIWWARNVEKKPSAFYLHGYLSGKFYPDFIVKVKNKGVYIVEYKGKQLRNEDTIYKNDIGRIWESYNHTGGFFRLVFKNTMQEFIDELNQI